jgi:hypothetical protein
MKSLLRFRLRTLFLVMAIVAGVLGWNVHRVRERADLIKERLIVYAVPGPYPGKKLPILWSYLGAKPVSQIWVHESVPDDMYERFVSAFPEAVVKHSVANTVPGT